MKFEALMSGLKGGKYSPVYFLQGNEPYYIDQVSDFIENKVLSETEKEFNQTVIYGRDTDISSVITMARRYPMMSNHQVVIVKEAQEIKDLVPKKNSKNEPALIPYLQRPQPTTLLVLCHKHKAVDKRTKLYKALAKHAVFFESNRLYDSKLPAWISNHVRQQGYKIGDDACILLSEFIGNDLSRIAHELDKLFLNIDKGGTIDMELIEKYVGISKEFNVFELQKAIGSRDILQANRIALHMAANERNNPLMMTLGSLSAYFNKIMTYHFLGDRSERHVAMAIGVPPFFVREYARAAGNYPPSKVARVFSLLRECDMRSKGAGTGSGQTTDIMKELVYKILH